jgi:hypothetical protein
MVPACRTLLAEMGRQPPFPDISVSALFGRNFSVEILCMTGEAPWKHVSGEVLAPSTIFDLNIS